MAFPGGRQSPADADLLATAVRETREEVALDLGEHCELLGRLDDVQAIGRGGFRDLIIVPYVFVLAGEAEPRPAADQEVAEVCWAPLGPMRRGDMSCTFPYVLRGESVDFPGYQVGPHVVWGLTYRMLQQLFAVLHGA